MSIFLVKTTSTFWFPIVIVANGHIIAVKCQSYASCLRNFKYAFHYVCLAQNYLQFFQKLPVLYLIICLTSISVVVFSETNNFRQSKLSLRLFLSLNKNTTTPLYCKVREGQVRCNENCQWKKKGVPYNRVLQLHQKRESCGRQSKNHFIIQESSIMSK